MRKQSLSQRGCQKCKSIYESLGYVSKGRLVALIVFSMLIRRQFSGRPLRWPGLFSVGVRPDCLRRRNAMFMHQDFVLEPGTNLLFQQTVLTREPMAAIKKH